MSEIQRQMLEHEVLHITVTYGNLNANFSGNAEDVLKSVNEFVAKNISGLNLARKVTLNFSIGEVIEKFQEFIRITPEGPRVMLREKKLSDKELVALQLVAERIAYETSISKYKLATLAKLQESTSLNPKTLSSRLSELSKAGFVARETLDSESGFRITTTGIDWLTSNLSKKKS